MSDRDTAGPETAETPHRLGEFRFAGTMAFTVYGDDPRRPNTVRVVLDDGVQAPYRILTIEGAGRFYPPPESSWLEGWIHPIDPWARIIYGNAMGVVRRARSGDPRRRDIGAPSPRPQ
ncbi:hypothetical protein LO763_25905 [Glycomyces sp. A-F 0318]|uniref:hypothetical protein n=1 Tax=Glycomyces amatae TaxID=2881355 RepID=UPI001E47D0C3|nr:hypothetical protein [Glycomyces amatae]MCD0447057.1 hypothetical protein [Glycomyces amatae]